ncbi:MAG: alanine--tRNA ligase [Nitrospirae bacterium]|nr:alanine--tRNA ligase [Nitrospirota bacterium]
MKSSETRQIFIDFFQKKGHAHLPSLSLIPKDDPTLLFTNAGMVQFKSNLLAPETAPYKRAVTVQKCMRAGGKHNDLENVGRTARHHTFFEMLGNFSFGDYFKKEAIIWAWEFMTERLKLSKDKLIVSVYEKDDDAALIWQKEIGIKTEKIFRGGEKDNFWQMGDTGPCGPCSEILIDQGAGVGCGKPDCAPGCDCDRFLELWNLVFMQYEKDVSGKLTPLPKPCIDTGMGLERLSAVLQGKHSNFHSDLFMLIIKEVEGISKKTYGKNHNADVSINVIADHIRAIAFILSEGLMPSNEGRGYVLRRVIRRAARHGLMLGITEPFLYKVIDSVFNIMSESYPELLENTKRTKQILKFEEERFSHTLSAGTLILDEIIRGLKSSGENTIPGSELFKLYDTYGFPIDLARDTARDHEIAVDEKGFEKEMQIQKTRARASWVGAEAAIAEIYKKLLKETCPTKFSGYETMSAEGTVKAVIKNGISVDEAKEGDEVEIVLNETPFYGESGGQVGDKGVIKAEALRIEVKDTKKINEIISHVCLIKKGVVKTGMKVYALVDNEERKATMRNHTATHLLQSALRHVLGEHVKQAGSLVEPERLRFDFTHFSPMEDREIQEVEDIVNEKIMENLPVKTSLMSIDDAIGSGAIALFGEKYGEEVRVVKAGDFTSELCGGTHCSATGEIGLFKIISEGSVAAGIRRIEATTGTQALGLVRAEENELKSVAQLLKVKELNASERLKKFIADIKSLEKELERLKSKAIAGKADTVLSNVITVGNINVLSQRIDGYDMKALRQFGDTLKDKIGSGILVLGSVLDSQVSYVTMVTKDLTAHFNAGEILRAVTGGKGGGRPDMAQGGTKDVEGIDKALKSVYDVVKRQVKT